MVNYTMARKAGNIGIISAVVWMIAVIMQHSLNLFAPDGSSLWIVHQLLALTSLAGVAVGFLGLIPSGAVISKFGKTAVILFAIGRGLIILGGLASLFLRGQDSPIFLVFPIGGTLSDIAALLIGIAVITAKSWTGWQRWMPLVHSLVTFLGISLPMGLGAMNGPGLAGELIQGALWLGVALAVFTSASNSRTFAASPQGSQQ